MANPQLHPLEVNPRTGEPFLRLKNHKHIILTPPRPADIIACVPLINDPRVHESISGPPIPYLAEHSQAFFELIKTATDDALAEMHAARDIEGLITLRHCPIRVIREVKDDGEDVFLGDIGFDRMTDGRLLALPNLQPSDEQKVEYVNINSGRAVGDPDIIWTIGDYLSPSHHGQGIMTDALGTLLWEWAVPRMSVRRITAAAFGDNQGSVKVFQKNGFVLTKTLENYVVARGKMRDLHVLEWDRDNVKPPANSVHVP